MEFNLSLTLPEIRRLTQFLETGDLHIQNHTNDTINRSFFFFLFSFFFKASFSKNPNGPHHGRNGPFKIMKTTLIVLKIGMKCFPYLAWDNLVIFNQTNDAMNHFFFFFWNLHFLKSKSPSSRTWWTIQNHRWKKKVDFFQKNFNYSFPLHWLISFGFTVTLVGVSSFCFPKNHSSSKRNTYHLVLSVSILTISIIWPEKVVKKTTTTTKIKEAATHFRLH